MRHAMCHCYCFGFDITVRFIETQMFQSWIQTSGLNRKWCKVKFLTEYLQWIGTTPYSQGAQEIPFKLHSFKMSPRLMGQWTKNIRRTVTDKPFWRANMSKCTFDKKKNPYWFLCWWQVNNSSMDLANFYTYWRSWQPILANFMPTEDLSNQFLQ